MNNDDSKGKKILSENVIEENKKNQQIILNNRISKNNHFKIQKLKLLQLAKKNLEIKNKKISKNLISQKSFLRKNKNESNNKKYYLSPKNNSKYDKFVNKIMNKLKEENKNNIQKINEIRKEIPDFEDDYFFLAMNKSKKKIEQISKNLILIKTKKKKLNSLSLPPITNVKDNSRNHYTEFSLKNETNSNGNENTNFNEQFSFNSFLINNKENSYRIIPKTKKKNYKNLSIQVNICQ